MASLLLYMLWGYQCLSTSCMHLEISAGVYTIGFGLFSLKLSIETETVGSKKFSTKAVGIEY